jgi:hypothetical protein
VLATLARSAPRSAPCSTELHGCKALDSREVAFALDAPVRPTGAFNGAAPDASVASSENNGGAKCHNWRFKRISPFGIGGEASDMLTRP